ncbi:neurogenin-3-like [Penaeus japonicus]|uniref:neurogenin-3-like n=1 Tax=Penaeus japonicus TaxID=27405 RepID=UPI001C717828|nr:neurogenin-3-like [Penaeus japonicus]
MTATAASRGEPRRGEVSGRLQREVPAAAALGSRPAPRSDSDWNFGESPQATCAAPLSRYRRKTANARERYRMRQINTAFESLRGVLPSWVCSRRAASDMTKIATLRLASAYIRSLQDILDGSAPQDTCSWVLSTILGQPSSQKATQNDTLSSKLNTGSRPHYEASEISPTSAELSGLRVPPVRGVQFPGLRGQPGVVPVPGVDVRSRPRVPPAGGA